MNKTITLLVIFLCAFTSYAQQAEMAKRLRTDIEYLASDELEGRRAGTPGAEKAAAYIAECFRKAGLKPFGDNGTYFQPFEFTSGIALGSTNALSALCGGVKNSFAIDIDYTPLGFSSNAAITGEMVFAGYGISAPDLNYDDYAGLDVKDKIVLVLRYSPAGDSVKSDFNKFSSARYKAMTARDKGAKALLLFSGSVDDSADALLKLRIDNGGGNSGIPVLSVKRSLAAQWLEAYNSDTLQAQLNRTRQPHSLSLADLRIELRSDVVEIKSKSSNVVGLLQVTDTAKTEYLVIGAHYDHLGYGGEESMAPGVKAIHHGADDNASGTAGIMELMRHFTSHTSSLRRNIIFVAFSGEEEGILGSSHFVKHSRLPLERLRAMLNLDMVGRLQNKTLTVQGSGTSSLWNTLLPRYNADSTFTLTPVKDGFGGSDQSAFYAKNIPVLFFFTGIHADYHKPSDEASKINFDGEAQVVSYVAALAQDIDTAAVRPDFKKVESTERSGGDRRGGRVYSGVIPDFAEQADGFRISGVTANSPSAKAGLLGGDVIIRFGKHAIKNISDYMYALQSYKVNDEVDVVYKRGGVTNTAKVRLESRKN